MRRSAVSFLLFLLVSCSSVTITPAHLRKSSLADHRRRAAELIGSEHLKKHLPNLLIALKSDSSPLVRAQSAIAIGELGIRNKQVYEALLNSIHSDPSPMVQQDVIYSLVELEYKKALPVLKKKLRSSVHPEVRTDAALAIKTLGNPDSTDVLVQCLTDQNYMVRHACLEALQSLTDQKGPLDQNWWKNHLKTG